MKQIEENSYITDDGMIWYQIYELVTALDFFFGNISELYKVNLEDESESLLETEDDINKAYALNSSCIVCIPVGKMEKIGSLYRPNINLKINNDNKSL